MKEGWFNEIYWVVFDESEFQSMTDAYGISEYLPGYKLIAIRFWDDFVLMDAKGRFHVVPTVPLDKKHLKEIQLPTETVNLVGDERFKGKIKWYLKPIIFSGSPTDPANIHWVNLEQHQQLVRFWNDMHRTMTGVPS